MRVFWTESAQADLEQIGEYISRHNPQAALATLQRLRTAAEKLSRFPEIGRTGKIEGTREVVVPATDYFIVYAIQGGTVLVFGVIHGSRDWPN